MVEPDRDPADLLPLTPACFLILLAFARGVRHGYGVIAEVEQLTRGRTTLGPGTLYRTIQRMLLDGLLSEGEDVFDEDVERRRYYQVTEFGRRVAVLETERHADLVRAAVQGGLVGDDVLGLAAKAYKKGSR